MYYNGLILINVFLENYHSWIFKLSSFGFFVLTGYGIVHRKTDLPQLNNSYFPAVLCIFVKSLWSGGPNSGDSFIPPIVPIVALDYPRWKFLICFSLWPWKDVSSLFLLSVIPLVLRVFDVSLALSYTRVYICVLDRWRIVVYTCTYTAHIYIYIYTHAHGRMHVFALVGVYGPYLYARVRVREYVVRH